MGETRWQLFPDGTAVAEEAAARILAAATQALSHQDRFRLVLAGGRTPEQAFRILATAKADWQNWEIYYGDERCLPADHPDRNSQMATKAWLEHVSIPAAQIHPMAGEKGPVDGAQEYAALLANTPAFDLVLLGLGEDGHTASLFPGHIHPEERVHVVFNAPKPPPERISLSAATIAKSHAVLFLVTGAGKRQAVSDWKAGIAIPAASISAVNGVDILIDEAANAPV